MLTNVASDPHGAQGAGASIREAEEARVLRRDATAMIERMAVTARGAGLEHPVAAAVALAARVSRLSGPEEFAEGAGFSLDQLEAAEGGRLRFGELPPAYDPILAALDVDLLSLADLEIEWRRRAEAPGHLF